MKNIQILIVDDHTILRAGLAGLLNNHDGFEVIGEAGNGKEAIELSKNLNPDVILMDLKMPEMDGVSSIKEILKIGKTQKILVLTTYDSDSDLLPAIEAGATGYILKDAASEELFDAIIRTSKGETAVSPNIAARLFSRMRQKGEDKLSLREIEVLNLVAEGNSNKDIANDLHISTATVKTHLIHIYGKLGVNDRTSAVTEAIKKDIIRLK